MKNINNHISRNYNLFSGKISFNSVKKINDRSSSGLKKIKYERVIIII